MYDFVRSKISPGSIDVATISSILRWNSGQSIFSEKAKPIAEGVDRPEKCPGIQNVVRKVTQYTRYVVSRKCSLVEILLTGVSIPDIARIGILRPLLRNVVCLVKFA